MSFFFQRLRFRFIKSLIGFYMTVKATYNRPRKSSCLTCLEILSFSHINCMVTLTV